MLSIPPMTQKLQQTVGQIDPWIQRNKPTRAVSGKVLRVFMARYGEQILGSDDFVRRAREVIEEGARLTTGITVMRRLLNAGCDITIQEGQENYFQQSDRSIRLNFKNNRAYVCLNEAQKRSLSPSYPDVAGWIHESLHAWHEFTSGMKSSSERDAGVHLSEMDDAEEELVITGNLHLDPNQASSIDLCCENSALRELGCPLRINHRGTLDHEHNLHTWVQHRILSKIQELIGAGKLHNEKNEKGLTALELALHLHLLESDPEILLEREKIIYTLIEGGCHSEYALRLAILQHSRGMMFLLLKAGAPLTEELLSEAVQEISDRFATLWKILEDRKWVYSLERLLPIAIPKGADPTIDPREEFFKKLDKQAVAVRGKFSDDGTLPIHSLEGHAVSGEYSNRFPKTNPFWDVVWQWKQDHPYRPAHRPKPLPWDHLKISETKRSAPPSAGGIEKGMPTEAKRLSDNGAFDYMPDGTIVTSPSIRSCFPECHKFYEDFGQLDYPAFTTEEINSFIKIIPLEKIRLLASSLSNQILKSLNLNSFGEDWELSEALDKQITPQLLKALTSPMNLLKKESFTPTYYVVDIPAITEDGQGIFQQIKGNFGDKYLDTIKTLRDGEEKQVTSVVCRLMLQEHLCQATCRIHFGAEIVVNGKVTNQIGYG
jgi:hypothetical protein